MKKQLSPEEFLPLFEKITKSNGIFPLTVTGTSMTPTLYSNCDTVNLVSPKIKAPQKYDIVLFVRNDGKLVLHRIIRTLPNKQFLINGDSQTWTEIISSSQIIAVTQSFTRNHKLISCNSFKFKFYSRIWCFFRPLRPVLFRISKNIKRNSRIK